MFFHKPFQIVTALTYSVFSNACPQSHVHLPVTVISRCSSSPFDYFRRLNFRLKMIKNRSFKSVILCLPILTLTFAGLAQQRRPTPAVVPVTSPSPLIPPIATAPKSGPRAYKDVITDKAVSQHGLFTVHRIEDKWYFEIPDSILGRDILVVKPPV